MTTPIADGSSGPQFSPDAPAPAVKHNLLIDLLVLLGIALVGVVTWKLQPRADIALPLSACDLAREACTADLPRGGSVQLAMEPRPIPTLRPIRVHLKLRGFEADKVEVDFAGVSMNMGFNRPQLRAAGAGEYVGEATLPVCVTGRMQWQATALLHAGRETISLPFRFEAGRE